MKIGKLTLLLILGLFFFSTAFSRKSKQEHRFKKISNLNRYHQLTKGFDDIDFFLDFPNELLLKTLSEHVALFNLKEPEEIINAIKSVVKLRKLNRRFRDLLTIQNIAYIFKNVNFNVNVAFRLPVHIHYGWTALHFAADNGCIEIFKILLALGADVNKKTWFNQHVLHLASAGGHKEIVKMVLRSGKKTNPPLDVNVTTLLGQTALHLAVQNGDEEITQSLLSYGAKIDVPDIHGWTPLLIAVKYDHFGVFHKLLLGGANPNLVINNPGRFDCGYSALHLAAMNGMVAFVRVLLECGARVDVQAGDGTTPLLWAVRERLNGKGVLVQQYSQVIKLLIADYEQNGLSIPYETVELL